MLEMYRRNRQMHFLRNFPYEIAVSLKKVEGKNGFSQFSGEAIKKSISENLCFWVFPGAKNSMVVDIFGEKCFEAERDIFRRKESGRDFPRTRIFLHFPLSTSRFLGIERAHIETFSSPEGSLFLEAGAKCFPCGAPKNLLFGPAKPPGR